MNSKGKENTIAEAAYQALQLLGSSGTIPEIYGKICESNLYTFNTPTPEHVLRTEIRRKTQGVDRVDSSKEVMFKLVGDEIYDVMKEPTKRRAGGSTKRVQRATDKRDIIGLLTSEGSGAFSEIWRVLLFAAAVGFKSKRREPLAAVESGDAIRQESFENSFVWPGMLYLLGLVETDSADVLRSSEDSEDERVRIFEEYANGGLAIMKERFEVGTCNLDGLLNFIQEQTTLASGAKPDLQITI